MKRFVTVSSAVIFLLIPLAAFSIDEIPAAATSTTNVPLTQVMTAEEAVALRAQLSALAKAMDVNVNPPKSVNEEKSEQKAHKTAADVADRALTMVSGLVAQLAQSIEKIAPQLWRIMIRQQYSKAAGNLLFPWAVFLFVFIYWLVARKRVPKMIANWDGTSKRELEREVAELTTIGFIFAHAIPIVVMVIFAFRGCWALSESIQLLINPEYYAVRDILQMLLKPEAM